MSKNTKLSVKARKSIINYITSLKPIRKLSDVINPKSLLQDERQACTRL